MAKSNKQIMDAVVSNMSEESARQLQNLEGVEVARLFDDNPNLKNEFINTLTNKVTKTLIFSKAFENPLQMLKQGALEYGDTIEQVFCRMSSMKNMDEHWEGSTTTEGDLIKPVKPSARVQYISKNVAKKFKHSISDKQLRKAFHNEEGLYKMIMEIVTQVVTKINYEEMNMMLNTLCRAVDGVTYEGVDFIQGKPDVHKMYAKEVVGYESNPQQLVEDIRAIVGDLKFPSTKYNMSGELTYTNTDDLVLVTLPSVNAKIDVNVLAHAFNVSNTDLNVRVIEVPHLNVKGVGGQYTTDDADILQTVQTTNSALPTGKKPIAVLMDKDFLQIWDTWQGAGTFYNAEQEYVNYFASREYIMACALFSNSILFYA